MGGGCSLSRRRSCRPDLPGLLAASALEHPAASLVPLVEYLEARRLYATGPADVGRYECYAVADVQRLALFPIVRRAERNDVPIAVARIAPLNVRTHCWLLDARYLRAKRGKRLATEFLPVAEPATAFAGVVADAVNVVHSHGDLISCCLAVICD